MINLGHFTERNHDYYQLQDIYDVHRCLKFCNYHFENYSVQHFMNDVANRGKMYLNKEYVDRYLLNETITPGLNFYPEYISC